MLLRARKQRLYFVSSSPSQVSADKLTLKLTVADKTDLHPRYGIGHEKAFWVESASDQTPREGTVVRAAAGVVISLDQSDASNAGFRCNFYSDADKTGPPLGTTQGVPGQPGSSTEIVVDQLPIFYEAEAYSGMGAAVLQSAAASVSTEIPETQLATVTAPYQWVRQTDGSGGFALLGPGLQLEGLDLRGASLNGLDLSGVVLRNVLLDNSDMEGATLTGTSFDGASLKGASLRQATVGTADFTGANMTRCSLQSCDLTACVLRKIVSAVEGDSWTGTGLTSGNRLQLVVDGFPESQREMNGTWTLIEGSHDTFYELVGVATDGTTVVNLSTLATGPVLRFENDESLLMLPMVGGFGQLQASASSRWVVIDVASGSLCSTGPDAPAAALTPVDGFSWQTMLADGSTASTPVSLLQTVWLRTAVLSAANMHGADLSGQNLTGVAVGGADLSQANASSARLNGADVRLDIPLGEIADNVGTQRFLRAVRVFGWTGGAPVAIADTYTWDASTQTYRGNSDDSRFWTLQNGNWTLRNTVGTTYLTETAFASDKSPVSVVGYGGSAHVPGLAVVSASRLLTNLQGTNLTSARLDHADLSQHDLRDCVLTSCSFDGCKIVGAVVDPAAWGGGSLASAYFTGVRTPQALSVDLVGRQVTPYVRNGQTHFVLDDGVPLLAQAISGTTLEHAVQYAVQPGADEVSATLSNGTVLGPAGQPPAQLSTPGSDYAWLGPSNGPLTLVGPGMDLHGVTAADLEGLDALADPETTLAGVQLHGISGESSPPSLGAPFKWLQGSAGWTLIGPGLSYARADVSGLDLSTESTLSLSGVQRADNVTLPSDAFAFVDLLDGTKALFGPGADLRGTKLGGLTSVPSTVDITGMRINNVRMTADEAANAWKPTNDSVWVEQPDLRTSEGSRYALIAPGVDFTGANLDGLDTALGNLSELTLAGSKISRIPESVKNASDVSGTAYNWVKINQGASAGTYALVGPDAKISADLRSASLADMSLSNADLSEVTLENTRIYNITDRSGVKLPSGDYTWVSQGGGKEFATGPGLSLSDVQLDDTVLPPNTNLDSMSFANASLRNVQWNNASVRNVPPTGTAGTVLDDGFAFVEQSDGRFAMVGPGLNTVGLELAPPVVDELGSVVLSMQRTDSGWQLGFPAAYFRSDQGDRQIAFSAATESSYVDVTSGGETYRFEVELLDAQDQAVFPVETIYAHEMSAIYVKLQSRLGTEYNKTNSKLALERGRTYRVDLYKTTQNVHISDTAYTSGPGSVPAGVTIRTNGAPGQSGSFLQFTTNEFTPNEFYLGGDQVATVAVTLPVSANAANVSGEFDVYPLAAAEDATLSFDVRVENGEFRVRRAYHADFQAASSALSLVRDHVYHFEQNDPSNEGNPLRFTSSTGPDYRYDYLRQGTDAEGIPGDPMGGSYLRFEVSPDASVHPSTLFYASDMYGPTVSASVELVDLALHSVVAMPGDGRVLVRTIASDAGKQTAWSYDVDGGTAKAVSTGRFAVEQGLSVGTHTVAVGGAQSSQVSVAASTGTAVAFLSAPAVDAQGHLTISAAATGGTQRWAYRIDELQMSSVPVGTTTVRVDLAGRTSGSVLVFAVDASDGTPLAVDLRTFGTSTTPEA